MIKLHFTEEWLRKAIANDGNESCEAGGLHPEAPRFSIEHGVIHDRNTGKHVRTDNSLHPHQDGIKEAVALLNELDHDARLAPYLHNALDRIRALQADRGRMREALEPFAKHAARFDRMPGICVWDDNVEIWQQPNWRCDISVGDLRRARAALKDTL